jgi:1,4-alpha-glucan branching enzyme
MATFRVSAAEHPAAPALIGDFTGWQPVAMTKSGDVWTATVAVRPGAHHYAFRAADGRVVVPPGAATVDDGFGGRSAVLVVP